MQFAGLLRPMIHLCVAMLLSPCMAELAVAQDTDPAATAAASQPADWESGWPGRGTGRGPHPRFGNWRDRKEGEERGPMRGFDGPGRRSQGPPGDSAGVFEFLTPDEQKDLMGFTQQYFPEVHQRLTYLEKEDPAGLKRAQRRIGWPMLRLMRLQKHDPELAARLIAEQQIEMQIMSLRRDYLTMTSPAERESIRAKLTPLIERRFDLRQTRLEQEIKDLEARLEETRQRLSHQQANKAEMVAEDVDEVIEDWENRESGSGHTPPPEDGPPPGRPPAPPAQE